MEEMQTEIQDSVDSSLENKNGIAGTSPSTINRTDGKDCTSVEISNPVFGSRKNSFQDVLYVTVDGSDPITNGKTIGIGQGYVWEGKILDGNIKIASNNANTNYEAVLVG